MAAADSAGHIHTGFSRGQKLQADSTVENYFPGGADGDSFCHHYLSVDIAVDGKPDDGGQA